MTLAEILADYADWRGRRADQSALEERGEADADDWAALDDEGCDLARRFADAVSAPVWIVGHINWVGHDSGFGVVADEAAALALLADDIADHDPEGESAYVVSRSGEYALEVEFADGECFTFAQPVGFARVPA